MPVAFRALRVEFDSLMMVQTFPNRTEGSVKKHWYKVRLSNHTTGGWLADVHIGHALCGVCRRRGWLMILENSHLQVRPNNHYHSR